jgi:flagellar export protein FliJ
VCALRAVIDLRERQRDEAAQELAAARRQQELREAALREAHAHEAAVPRSAPSADLMEIYQRAGQAARQRIEEAHAALLASTRDVERLAAAHRERARDHQGISRVAEHRATERRRVDDRRERSFLDDLAGRRVVPWGS